MSDYVVLKRVQSRRTEETDKVEDASENGDIASGEIGAFQERPFSFL
jgi:hypothetical protein